jgi:hypothetical protein
VTDSAKTPTRPIRIPHEDWEDFGVLCASSGTNRSKAIREYIAWCLERPSAPKRLTRPKPDA